MVCLRPRLSTHQFDETGLRQNGSDVGSEKCRTSAPDEILALAVRHSSGAFHKLLFICGSTTRNKAIPGPRVMKPQTYNQYDLVLASTDITVCAAGEFAAESGLGLRSSFCPFRVASLLHNTHAFNARYSDWNLIIVASLSGCSMQFATEWECDFSPPMCAFVGKCSKMQQGPEGTDEYSRVNPKQPAGRPVFVPRTEAEGDA
ncbi:hypothetical protein F2P81_000272 [Scophthalmus maximus]|uniref:Uncharacterized protein n=1 Tax=Scophthalmus maximus TaxID=52904 RepID=A0A6A4TP55_SCOMX|nr:hypothetical protein F2P81_000272 [Scophthalmus maximus]